MRRSTTITLTLLAAGTGLGLAYCSRDPDTEGVLETQAACVDRLGAEAATECQDVFRSAEATHQATAPRFATAEACREATGGDCVPLEPGADATAAGVFIPAMAGVMIGRTLLDGSRGATPVYAGPPPAGTSSGSGWRFWYSANIYAGSSDGNGRNGFRRASASSGGEGLLSRGARSGSSASRSGGLGFSAAAHSGHGS